MIALPRNKALGQQHSCCVSLRTLSARQRNVALALVGLAIFAIFFPARSAVRHDHINTFLALATLQALLCLFAAALIWNTKSTRTTLLLVLGIGALLRLSLLWETPKLSDDVYRYVWDGRVQAAGINPYRYIPADPHLVFLRDDAIYPHINRRDYAPTIYPPMTQMIFRAVHQVTGSVAGFKACLLGFEAITIWALARLLTSFGLPRERVLIYAWNPLVVWEFSGSGHIDAAMIAFVALALLARRGGRDTLTGVLLGAAVLTKFYPIVLLPALYRRWDWKMPLAAAMTFCLGYLAYLSAGRQVVGFLSTYADEEGIRSGRYFLLLFVRLICGGAEIPASLYFLFVFAVLAAIAGRALFHWNERDGGFLLSAGLLGLAFTFLLSPQFAWYWSWLVPFLAFLPLPAMRPFFLLTLAALVHYATWFDDWRLGLHPHLALCFLQLIPAGLLLAFIRLRRHRCALRPSALGLNPASHYARSR